jgi:DNA-binding CsgD family transcriptional regulator
VNTHLRNVFSKLGVNFRRELTELIRGVDSDARLPSG